MADGSRTLKLSILADVDNLKKGLTDAGTDTETFGGKLSGFGKAAGAAFAVAGAAALAYAGESMRLTTRLMQVASWLLVQRAVRDGEIQLTEAASDKYRLISREPQAATSVAGADELPQALKALIIKGGAIYERVRRLDETMYDGGDMDTVNPVSDQLAMLQQAFGR